MLLILLLGIFLSLPMVQTGIAQYVTKKLNEDFNTTISVEKVRISAFGGVKLKKILIKDHHQDTLIFVNRIRVTIPDLFTWHRIQDFSKAKLQFGSARINGLFFKLKTYKGEKDSNINIFINLFHNDNPPSEDPFILDIRRLHFEQGHFSISNENSATQKILDFTKINAYLKNFSIVRSDIHAEIRDLALEDHRGICVEKFQTKFSFSKEKMVLEGLDILTKNSFVKGNVILTYMPGDLAYFVDKVNLDIRLDTLSLSTNDLNYFYNEFGAGQKLLIKSKMSGTLNDLYFQDFIFSSSNHSQVVGKMQLKNIFESDKNTFFIAGDFKKIISSRESLSAFLPKLLGNKLPKLLDNLGQFEMEGAVKISKNSLDTNLLMRSDLGAVNADLILTNITSIENAKYKGNVELHNFNIGQLLNNKNIKNVSLNLNVDGVGFTEHYLNTKIKGNISNLDYNGYLYHNIDIDGTMKNPFFEGLINVNDHNLKMSFDGLVDLSQEEYKYDFNLQVDYANLYELKFVSKDTLSLFKGNLVMKVTGNTLEDIYGELKFNNTSYQNALGNYYFDDFIIKSTFDSDKVRTITINSPDIIEGTVEGRYQYGELHKIVENALGSLYTHYSYFPISSGQFIKFNFKIYNKIIEIFYPEISLGNNTYFSGYINSDEQDFKFNFDSPHIKVFDNYFDKIKIDIDNKNPFYNAYVELDSVRTPYYKISNFNLVNVTANDTLFVRSEFKGGDQDQDMFNINLYHTVNEDSRFVLGFKKSEIDYRDFKWFINEKSLSDNKIIFNKSLTDVDIDGIKISHDDQFIKLSGIVKDSIYKDINILFKDVDISKISPLIHGLDLDGNLDGTINFNQNKNIYKPTSSIVIEDLKVNKIPIGALNLSIKGNEALDKFVIDTYLYHDYSESFSARGNLQIANNMTKMFLDVKLDQFNLGIFSPLGGTIIDNLRGSISGRTSFEGDINNLDINGRLFLDKTSMRIPYLNVDYGFEDNAVIDITTGQFLFRDIEMRDTRYNTKGRLKGSFKHKNFKKWQLDLGIESSKILVLDTKDSESVPYYGKAFIEGNATIKGLINALLIDVNAKSKTGTSIKIPVNNSEEISESSYINFLTPVEKSSLEKGISQEVKNYGGLELKFNLDFTPDAEVEILLDKNTGHGIKGKGSGKILLDINTLGKFNMYGNYQVYEGIYNYKFGGLIDKKFLVKRGSYISWEGEPLRALLNIQAVYQTEANPAVLLDYPSFNRKTPVDVVIALTGNLSNPYTDFNINFSNVSSVLKSEIQYKLDDKDTREKQAIFLLASGSFLGTESAGGDAVKGNLYEKASSLFNDIFDDPESKFKIGVNYRQGSRVPGLETDDRFGFTFLTQINDNISINGKLGVPVGTATESAVVGDLEMLIKLNKAKTFNARVFNRENDINYVLESIGYTQGVGISYRVDFDSFKELVDKLFNKSSESKKEKEQKKQDILDSDMDPDFIKFIENRNRSDSKFKPPHKEYVPELD